MRQATIDDLPEVERLRLRAFADARLSAWRGMPDETKLRIRLQLWQVSANALPGVLVGTDAGRVVGTVAVATTATNARLSRAELPVLRTAGLPRMTWMLLVWTLTRYEPLPDEAFMHSIVVLPEYRRRHAGRVLTEAAEELARSWGKRIVSASVARGNTPSRSLLRSLGYDLITPPPRNLLDRLLMRDRRNLRAEKVL